MSDATRGSRADLDRFPWLRLLRGAGVATDSKKLILSAIGLVLLWSGWELLDRLFPGSRAITPHRVASLPPSPFDPARTVGETLGAVAGMVAEPARTLTAPFVALFALDGGNWAFLHASLAALWTALIWGVVGGAIARIAVVQVATGDRIGLGSAIRFVARKEGALIGAPLSPLVGVGFFAALCALLGLLYQAPGPIGATIAGALAFLPILAGLIMALILLGLAVGWPLMIATVATEGEDGFDALSRSYAYVFQKPMRYAGYVLLAWAVGTAGLLVVDIFARAVVHLAQWGLAFGGPDLRVAQFYRDEPVGGRTIPAVVHLAWLQFVGLLAYGWVYSYFWTAAAEIYLLLRHDVDGKDWDDVDLPLRHADPFSPEPAIVPAPGPVEPSPKGQEAREAGPGEV